MVRHLKVDERCHSFDLRIGRSSGKGDLGFDYSFVTAAAKNMYPTVFVENHRVVSKLVLDKKPECDGATTLCG